MSVRKILIDFGFATGAAPESLCYHLYISFMLDLGTF
jgi:hypothetical protein